MKKKAQGLGLDFFRNLVLAIVFLFFAMLLIMRIFGPNIKSATKDTVCWQSVLYNHERRIPGVSVETIKIKCPTKYVTFQLDSYKEEFEETGDAILKFNPFAPKEEDNIIKYTKEGVECSKIKDDDDRSACIFHEVNEKIAKEMERCWRNFHEGRLRVFSQYTTEKQCVVCTTFFFDNEMIDEYSYLGLLGWYAPDDPNYNLDLFMRTYKIEPSNTSYYEYTLDILDKNWEVLPYDYEVTRDYSIVFTALNEHFFKDALGDIWNKIKEKITHDPQENEPNYINTLNFIPNDEVAIQCDSWA